MAIQASDALSHIDRVLSNYANLRRIRGGSFDSGRYVPEDAGKFVAAAFACVARVAGSRSVYANQAKIYMDRGTRTWENSTVSGMKGLLSALRDDISANQLMSFESEAKNYVLSDMLDAVDILLEDDRPGNKDAAAVLAGGVLESRLRDLCAAHDLPTEMSTDDRTRPIRADALNASLAKAGVYSITTQKQVTAWLGIRNEAAHAHYNAYTKEQVAMLSQGVRDFLIRVTM